MDNNKLNGKSLNNIYVCVCVYGLVSLFSGISTFVSYLIPKLFS